ncbi:MAG: DUF998 domain-containing protein [Ornithinibacter sp.]
MQLHPAPEPVQLSGVGSELTVLVCRWTIVFVAAARSSDRRPRFALLAALASSMLLLSLAPLALPSSYSWVELGTSEAAAQGVAGAWVARLGFVLLGLAVLGVCVLRHRAWRTLATGLHACFGVGMVMVAVYSHAPWEAGVPYVELEDHLHSVFASVVGFSFIAGVAATLAARRPRTGAHTAGDITAILLTGTIPLLMNAPVWGVLQRLMFLIAACWYGSEALLQPAPEAAVKHGMRSRAGE